jgi:hypothetical protein
MTWGAFYLMDHLLYHRLLKGAVSQGHRLEEQLKNVIPGIALAGEISKHSPLRDWKRPIRSDHKIVFFYLTGALLIIALLSLALFIEVQTPQISK